MVGIACSQLIMGPLSDKFGRRPVLLSGLGLMVAASAGCIFAETLPQLIAARFLQALGGATGMVVSRAIIRSEEHTSELQSHLNLVCRLLLEKKKNKLQMTPAKAAVSTIVDNQTVIT